MHDRIDSLLDAVLAVGEDLDLEGVLRRVVIAASTLVGAPFAALGVLDEDGTELATFLHHGVAPDVVAEIGSLPRGGGLLGEVIVHPTPLRLRHRQDHPASVSMPPGHPPMDGFLGVPVRVGDDVFGNLYVTDKAGGFDAADERALVGLAAVAGAAVRNSRTAAVLAARQKRLVRGEERARIARDLHDTTVQRLFAAGLRLQAAAGPLAPDDATRAALDVVIDELDGAIRDLRTTIGELGREEVARPSDQLLALVEGLRGVVGGLVPLGLEGPVDGLSRSLVTELGAVLREGIMNAARHAAATRVLPTVRVGDVVEVVVDDDGRGPQVGARSPGHGHGLPGLSARAARLGGACTLEESPDGGARLRWWVPAGTTTTG